MNNKEKILQAASELFNEEGYDALSVRNIAKHANLSTIGIYSHFKGKRGILNALCQQACEVLTQSILRANGNTASDKVLDACENILNYAESNTAHYQLIFGGSTSFFSMTEETRAAKSTLIEAMAGVCKTLPKNQVSSDKAVTIATQVMALTHGYTQFFQSNHSPELTQTNWKDKALQAARLYVYAIVATQ